MADDPAAKIVILSGYDTSQPKLPELLNRNLIKGVLTKPVAINDLSCFLAEVLGK
jgi:hypothetical protein